jgi:phosphoserine phosphatase
VSQNRLLVVLDVDSTLTRDEGIDLLAQCVSTEAAAEVQAITASAMRGELDFSQSLIQRVSHLKGVTEEQIADAVNAVTVTDGARELVEVLRSFGHVVGAVSGGFHQMVDPLARELGLDCHKANTLEIVDGVVTGRLLGPIVGATEKAETLAQWASEHQIPPAQTVAIGDGGNDVLMLKEAGLGIAFMAKPVAKEAADISIDTPDLRQVLDVLGFIDL